MKSLPNLPLRREGAEETDQIISPLPSFTKGGGKVKKKGREMNSGRSEGELPSTPLFFKEGWGEIFWNNKNLTKKFKQA